MNSTVKYLKKGSSLLILKLLQTQTCSKILIYKIGAIFLLGVPVAINFEALLLLPVFSFSIT